MGSGSGSRRPDGKDITGSGEPAAAPPSIRTGTIRSPTPTRRAVMFDVEDLPPIRLLDRPSLRQPFLHLRLPSLLPALEAPSPISAVEAPPPPIPAPHAPPPRLRAPPASQVPPSVLLPLVEHALQQPPVQPVLVLVQNGLMRFLRNSLETYRAFENSQRIAFENFLALPTEVLHNYFWWTFVAIEVILTLFEVLIEEFGESHAVWIGLVTACFVWASIFASIFSVFAGLLTFDSIIESIVSFVNMLAVVLGGAARDLAIPLYWRLFLRFLVSIFIRIMWRIALRMARRQ